jgi:hypothetical protein
LETNFEEWVVIDLFGHKRLAGKATEATILGGALLRLDIPTKEGNVTQFIGPQAIYSMTPVSEVIARDIASQVDAAPVSRWELPQLPQAGHSLDGLDETFEGIDDGDEEVQNGT